jgi:hypothetical protein
MYVDDLEDRKLDFWVARAQGHDHGTARIFTHHNFCPSTDWEQGGPIIEKAFITITPVWGGSFWDAAKVVDLATHKKWWRGRTPLIAAMRCFVGSKFGTTVDDSA